MTGSLLLRAMGRASPKALLANHSRIARKQGLDGFRFLLSFDCDTLRDLAVVEDVHERCVKLGVTPAYAVPGELLEGGAARYRRLAAAGAEMMNHGHRPHTVWREAERLYESTIFYEDMAVSAIAADVRAGHEAHARILGRAPRGFRAPHFAGLGARERDIVYPILAELGYRYSSSMTPRDALFAGAIVPTGSGLPDVPITGGFDQPFSILDSYGYRYDPGRRVTEADYVRQFERYLTFFADSRRPGIMNVYADPSQVADWPDFFRCVELAAPHATTYEALLAEAEA